MEATPLCQDLKLDAVANGASDDAVSLNSSFLEFLADDVFGSEALDPATLAAVCQVTDSQPQGLCGGRAGIRPEAFTAAQPGSLVGNAPTMKRSFEDGGFSDSDDDDDVGKGERCSGKRSKGGEVSAAATKKACREKARREKLNERFVDLARLVDPGNEPKTDKSTILGDAIKYVQQVTVENHQLRQLNKFLEERVSTLERERGQQLYQQSLMMTAMGQGQMMPAGQAMLVGGHVGMLAGAAMAGAPMSHAQMSMQSANMSSSGSMPAAATPVLQSIHQQASPGDMMAQAPGGLLAQAPCGMMAQGGGAMMGGMMGQMSMPGATSASVGAAAAAAGAAFNITGTNAGAGPSKPTMVNTVQGMMPYQGMYWLPPQMMDSAQDSLLRPPAA